MASLCLLGWLNLSSRVSAGDLQTLRDDVARTLETEMTDHWFPRVVDKERGGFHQNFRRDWSIVPDRERSIVYQSRQTWTAARFAQHLPERREEYLRYARHGLAYLRDVMRDAEQGGFYWAVGIDGRPGPDQGEEKHIYGVAFAIYAAAKVYEVGGDAEALALARETFDWIEAHAHDDEQGGYFEALNRDGSPILQATERSRVDRLGIDYGYKTMNSHIHLLEAVSALARIDERPIVRQRLKELIEIVRDRIASEPGALHLYLTRDWKPVPAHDSFGHDVETSFLLVEAVETLGQGEDEHTWVVARRLVDHALDRGWDSEHGGFYDKGDSIGGTAYDTTKVWWTQAEGLNTLVLMHTKFGRETDRYLRALEVQWSFIAKHQIDDEHGGWFGEVTREGVRIGEGPKATPWKAAYHTGRSLMQVVEMIDRLPQDGNR